MTPGGQGNWSCSRADELCMTMEFILWLISISFSLSVLVSRNLPVLNKEGRDLTGVFLFLFPFDGSENSG